ncbi:MAG: segregation and condensation protein A [Dehalococcoidia bacterium]
MLEIRVDGFQGPLDLLLGLIEKEEMDITTLSLADVTDQYWQHIESQAVAPDALADFIVIGAKLLYVKSCALLPQAAPPRQEIRAGEDAGSQLAQMLQQYKRFKEAADLFRDLEERGRRAYPRLAPPKNIVLPPGLKGVTLDTLMQAVQEALARQPSEPEDAVLELEPFTVDNKIEEIETALDSGGGRLAFRPLLEACQSRTEIVVLFLATLELIKAGRLWAEQETTFGKIELVAVEPARS